MFIIIVLVGAKGTSTNCLLVCFHCVSIVNRAFRSMLYALAQCQKVRKGKQNQPHMTTSFNRVVHEGDGSGFINAIEIAYEIYTREYN